MRAPVTVPMRRLKIVSDVWQWDGWVVVGGNPTLYGKLTNKAYGTPIDDYEPEAVGCAFAHEGKPWMLWVQDEYDHATLAHEALHITIAVLKSRGVSLGDKSEEAYTYLMTHIVRSVLEAKKKDWKKVQL